MQKKNRIFYFEYLLPIEREKQMFIRKKTKIIIDKLIELWIDVTAFYASRCAQIIYQFAM